MDVEAEAHTLQTSRTWFTEYLERSHLPYVDGKVTISLDDIRREKAEVALHIIENPTNFIRLALDWTKATHNSDEKQVLRGAALDRQISISFKGNLGANFVTPRGLKASMANQLVGVEGLITKMCVPRYMLTESTHYCEKTETSMTKSYPDIYSLEEDFNITKNRTIPLKGSNDQPYRMEFGQSVFEDIQTNIVVQELPENAPAGQLPRSVNVVLKKTLTDKVKPGDRVQLMGVYKIQASYSAGITGIFRAVIVCTDIRVLNQNIVHNNVLKISPPFPKASILELFSKSICPSVQGHEELKKAVLLMLLGGVQKNLDTGTHLRGDINLLMVGDPGTAKSQMLRWVLNIAEISVPTTGSGASGVGLTAAITYDKDTNTRNIEAGAMVLADRGFVCIDEFDKMNEVDKVAVHEVMEQQTVTIAKAGVHCSLNARCSVFAAANPIYGEYMSDLNVTRNIGMQDSLVSRFDLIFIILDEKNSEKDKLIAERVCRNHKFSAPESFLGGQDEEDYIVEPKEVLQKQENMFEKNNIYKSAESRGASEILTQSYVKKYIHYCRKNIAPTLSADAVEFLSEIWSKLRVQKSLNDKGNTLPITIRTYEALIRLSTAHAKLRLSSTVEIEDCEEASKLMEYCEGKLNLEAAREEIKKNIKAKGGAMDEEPVEPTTSIGRATRSTTAAARPRAEEHSATTEKAGPKRRVIKANEDQDVDKVLDAARNLGALEQDVKKHVLALIKHKDFFNLSDLLDKLPGARKEDVVNILKKFDNVIYQAKENKVFKT